jgi:hypothetical protein
LSRRIIINNQDNNVVSGGVPGTARISRISKSNLTTTVNDIPVENLFFTGVPMGSFELSSDLPMTSDDDTDTRTSPREFDARMTPKWRNCASIGKVRLQGMCGSSYAKFDFAKILYKQNLIYLLTKKKNRWAVSVAAVISDRLCIKRKVSIDVSAEDLVSCCRTCWAGSDGCMGGYPDRAFTHFYTNGVVSGGGYKSNIGCKPYSFPSCFDKRGHYTKIRFASVLIILILITNLKLDFATGKCKPNGVRSPKCSKQCQPSLKKSYQRDLWKGDDKKINYQNNYRVLKSYIFNNMNYKAEEAYLLPSRNAINMLQEIKNFGPIVCEMIVYPDFKKHRGSSVYMHRPGPKSARSGHAIKIVGWGVERGVPYWIVINSWGRWWSVLSFNQFFFLFRDFNLNQNFFKK